MKCPTKCYKDAKDEECTEKVIIGCKLMPGMWPVVMADLGGYKTCAKRGGLPFKDAIRVDEEGDCTEEGSSLCNPGARKEN